MSQPAPIHEDSTRPGSPACALLAAPRCLIVSRVALPVHGVSTTPVTTPEPPSARTDQPRDVDPEDKGHDLSHKDLGEMSVPGRVLSLARLSPTRAIAIAQCPYAQTTQIDYERRRKALIFPLLARQRRPRC